MSFNINDYVKVKLNERGYEILRNYYGGEIPFFKETDDLGYISFQLWEFMYIFGNFVNLDDKASLPFDKCILLPFENDIVEYSMASNVNVSLTKAGIEHLKNIGEKDTKKITVLSIGGNTEFQFFELISKFGSLLYNGNNEIPFETNINIPEKYLIKPSSGIARK